MGVDKTLKYGQYNTYKMDAGEKLYADPFDVSQYSVITMQLVTIRTAGATTCEVGARWIDANNRKMGSDVLLTVNVLNRFSDWHHTLEVPEGAMSLQWWIKAGSASFNWACGKISPGSMPTAFSVDLTERTSMMTADGLYTSTISANQILAGIMRALSGKAWYDLEKPEIVMQGEWADWKASPSNPLEITDKHGDFIGGLAWMGKLLALVSTALTNNPESGIYATVGEWTVPALSGVYDAYTAVGIRLYDPTYSQDNPVAEICVARLSNQFKFEIFFKGERKLSADEDSVSIAVKNLEVWLNGSDQALPMTQISHTTSGNDWLFVEINPSSQTVSMGVNGTSINVEDGRVYKMINGTETNL